MDTDVESTYIVTCASVGWDFQREDWALEMNSTEQRFWKLATSPICNEFKIVSHYQDLKDSFLFTKAEARWARRTEIDFEGSIWPSTYCCPRSKTCKHTSDDGQHSSEWFAAWLRMNHDLTRSWKGPGQELELVLGLIKRYTHTDSHPDHQDDFH